jgi:predicted Zn-dependent protease
MADTREQTFQKLVNDFPDSPMGHFSLGKLYLEERRYAEAVACLQTATKLEPEYAAALVSLGEAQVGAGDVAGAKATLEKAHQVAIKQNHRGLAEEILTKVRELG